MAQPYVGEIRMFAGNFAPRMDVLRRAAPADLRERGAVPADRHDLRRRRRGDVRPAEPAEPRADPHGHGPDGTTYQLGETAGDGAGDADHPADPEPHPPADRRRRQRQPGRRPAATSSAQSTADRRSTSRTRRPTQLAASAITPGRRQPAAREHAAVPVHQLHHLAVRRFSRARPRRARMADPFVAEIRIFPFNFAPTGWAFCDGQLLPISQNTALFSLLGTHLRRRRQVDLRAAGPAGQRADAAGPGAGALAARSSARSAVRRRSRCCRARSRSTPTRSGVTIETRRRQGRSRRQRVLARVGRRQRLPDHDQREPRASWRRRRSRPPAAACRTTTCSPT